MDNRVPTWSSKIAWRLGAEPFVHIGGSEAEEQQLFDVRGAVRLSDGRVVVANGGTHELRFYAADGSYLFAVGRQGGGPGEFEQLSWIRPFGTESLVAYDSRLRRVSVYSTEGRLGQTIRFEPDDREGFQQLMDMFSDGTFLALVRRRLGPDTPSGIVRQPIQAIRYSADLTTGDSLGVFPGMEFFLLVFPDDIDATPLAFGKSTQFRAHDDRMYVATNDTYEVQVWGLDGALRMAIRKEHERIPVTQTDFDGSREADLEGLEGYLRARMERLYRDMPMTQTFPAYAGVHVDELNNVWVREYNRPGDERGRWTVFDSGGVLLGTLDAGERFGPLHVGDDFVLGLWLDELDVEHVQLYELIKG